MLQSNDKFEVTGYGKHSHVRYFNYSGCGVVGQHATFGMSRVGLKAKRRFESCHPDNEVQVTPSYG